MSPRRQHRQAHTHRAPGRRWPIVVTVLSGLLVIGTLLTGPVADELGITPPWEQKPCDTTAVEIVTSQDIQPVVSQILQELQDAPLPGNRCLRAYARGQAPGDTVAGIGQLPQDRIPHLWIPDSSLWFERIRPWKPHQVGTFATSPLILASSRAAAQALGWTHSPPTWAEAMNGRESLLLPNVANSTTGVLTLLTAWNSLGRTPQADRAVAAAVLSSAGPQAPEPSALVQAAQTNSKKALFLPASERYVRTRHSTIPSLVATYPRDGSPWLDYPLIRLSPDTRAPEEITALNAVINALTSIRARSTLYSAGLRDADRHSGTIPTDDAESHHPSVTAIPPPDTTHTQEFLQHLTALSMPSRILLAVDVSESMRKTTPQGISRIATTQKVVSLAGELLSDASSAGLWVFSRGIAATRSSTELAPVRPLSTADNGQTHRDTLSQHLQSLPYQVAGESTPLNETAVEAVRTMRRSYTPGSSNAVVIFTDGTEKTPGGLSLQRATAELRALYNPKEPIKLITIGIGPSADMTALRTLSSATDGYAYRLQTPGQINKILYDVLTRRDKH